MVQMFHYYPIFDWCWLLALAQAIDYFSSHILEDLIVFSSNHSRSLVHDSKD
jgi:hypothetical protein